MTKKNRQRFQDWVIPAVLAALMISGGVAPSRAQTYTWQMADVGGGGWVTGFCTNPSNANIRYCRTDVGNAYRWDSTNNIWQSMIVYNTNGTGIPASVAPSPGSTGCEEIATDPTNTSTVYMSFPVTYSGDSGNTALNTTVYKSTNGGVSFAATGLTVVGDPNGGWRWQCERMKVDPNNSNVVYYGTLQQGLWLTTNGGTSWSNVTAGGAPGSTTNVINIVFYKGGGTTSVNGQNVSSIIYLDETPNGATWPTSGDVYRSSNGGQTWTNISTGTALSGGPGKMTVDQNGNLWVTNFNVDSSLWKYSGGAWSNTTVGTNGTPMNVAVDPTNANRIFAGGESGDLSRSTDGGSTWTIIQSAFNFGNTVSWLPQPLVAWRSNSGIYFDANGAIWCPEGNEGVMTFTPSSNNTESLGNLPQWTVASQGINELVTGESAIPKGSGDTFFVTVQDASGIEVTNPNAFTANWVPLQTGLLSTCEGVAWCPNAPSFVAFNVYDNVTGTGNHSGYTANYGSSWTHFAGPPGNFGGSIAVSARGSWGLGADHMVILPDNDGLPMYSKNGGATWATASSFPAPDGGYWIYVLKQDALQADPFTPDTYYLKVYDGPFCKTTDGGVTWSSVSTALPNDTNHGKLKCNLNDQNDLWFADGWEGATAHGLWHSTNAGSTWTQVTFFTHAIALALGAGSGGSGAANYTVYCYGANSSNSYGIYQSTNGGTSWVQISAYPAGIIDQPTSLSASWDTYGLVYVTFGGQTAAYGVITNTGVPTAPEGVAATPGNGQVTLTWYNSSNGETSYNVYRGTTAGGESATAIATGITAATYTNTSLANGATYFYKIAAVNSSGTSVKSTEVSSTPTTILRIDAGGGTAGGSSWVADTDYSGGSTEATSTSMNTATVTNPAPQMVYETVREGALTYTIPGLTANGTYTVRLHFCDLDNSSAGQREFNVVIGSTQVLTNFDIVAAAGAGNTANIQQFTTTANGSGQIVIAFTTGAVSQPCINGIEILASTDGSTPAAPSGLSANGGNAQVGLTWNTTTNATSYNVLRSTTSGSGYSGISYGDPSASYTDDSVVNGITYYYVVSAVNQNGAGPNSSQAQVEPTGPPIAPAGVIAVYGNTQIALTWTACPGATSYNVYRGTTSGGESGTPIASGISTNTYTNTGLTNGATYFYVVTAVNSFGTSVNSNEVVASPEPFTPILQINAGGNAAPPYVADTDYSPSDTGDYLDAINTSGVVNPAPVAVYQTQRFNTAMTYTITGLTSGTTYTVRLHFSEDYFNSAGEREFDVAINNTPVLTNYDIYATAGGEFVANVQQFTTTGNSSGDIVIAFTAGAVNNPCVNGIEICSGSGGSSPPPAPTGLTASPGNAQVALTWNSSSGATSYNVYRGTTSGGENATAIATGITVTNYTNTGLTNGTTYYYKVTAVNSHGTSGYSNEASATPTSGAPPAPTGLTATPGNTQVALAWNSSSGATSYNVLRSTTSGSGYASVATGVTTTSYTNTGLTNGTIYYFVVAAVNASGTSANSSQASATPIAVPAAPTGLTATPGNTQVSLSWTASSGATSYSVYRGATSGGENATPIATGITLTSYTNTGLTNGTTYYYKVTAVNGSGTSGYSNEASAAPAAGSAVVEISCGSSTANGSFVADTDYAEGSTDSTSNTIITSGVTNPAPMAVYQSERVDPNGFTYTIPNLTANAAYTVRLHFAEFVFGAAGDREFNVAINSTSVLTNFDIYAAAGGQNIANIQQFSTNANGSGQIIIGFTTGADNNPKIDGIEIDSSSGSAPAAPTGLTAKPGNAQVALTWSSSTGATSYNVLRSTTSGSGYASVVTGVATTAYTNTGLTNGTTYYFVVAAVNGSGTSANSSQASATPVAPPAAPTGLNAAPGNTQVALTWSSSTGATSYNVLRSTTSGSGYASVTTGVTSTSYTNTGLTNGTTYYFVVAAVNAGGTSANSSQASAVPSGSPSAPTGLTATAGIYQVVLSWSSSSGATSYNVLRSTTSGSGYVSVVTGVTTTAYTNMNLSSGTTYYFVVDAVNSSGTSANSSQASAKPTTGTEVIEINSGGSAVSPYLADTDYVSGGTDTTSSNISTTGLVDPAPMSVYQSERSVGPFTYTIPNLTVNAAYTVRLHFAEFVFGAAGDREFNVSINSTQVLTNFDIYAAAGGENIGTIQQFDTTANSSGDIVIGFSTGAVNYAKVDGIEILH